MDARIAFRTLALFAVAATAALPVAPAAAAAGPTCQRHATVVSGKAVVPGYSTQQVPRPDGSTASELVRDPSKDRPITAITYQPVVVTSDTATLRYDGVVYTLTKDSNFILTCFAESKSSQTVFPSVRLLVGSAHVRAKAGRPGAVDTGQALVNPFARAAMTFEVVLTGTSELNVEQGVTHVALLKGSGRINVTPYVGPSPGTCRQVHTAELRSGTKGRPHGAASYDKGSGLA